MRSSTESSCLRAVRIAHATSRGQTAPEILPIARDLKPHAPGASSMPFSGESGHPPHEPASKAGRLEDQPGISLLAGFGLPPIRLGLDALELGRDIPPISNANIIEKANQEALIIRDGKADRVPFHTLDGPGVAKAIRDLGVRYGDPDRIAEVVFGHPHRWHASTGSWMGTVLEMPKGVGAAQQCGRKLAHWKWVIETIIDAACPGASMVVSQGSIINGTYAIRSSEFRTGIRNGFRTGCWAFERT